MKNSGPEHQVFNDRRNMKSKLSIDELTIPKLLKRNRFRYRRRVALREKHLGIWQTVSWDMYWQHVRNFSLGLKELGLKDRGDKVSILGDNCREWLYADIAAQCCRAIAVGIYPTNVAEQCFYVLDDSDSSMVVCKDQEQVDKVLEVKDRLPQLEYIIVVDMKGLRNYKDPMILSFNEVENIGFSRHEEDPECFEAMVATTQPDDVAIMVYTSGTTGKPKGAMITHSNMVAMIHGLSQVLAFDQKGVW